MVASPYLGLLIVQGNFDWALGVLSFAAVTDLVKLGRFWRAKWAQRFVSS